MRLPLVAIVVLLVSCDPPKPSEAPQEPSRTVPATTSTAASGRRPFDRGAAAGVISTVKLDVCEAADGPRATGHFTVTFTPDGTSKALLDDWSLADPTQPLGPKVHSPFVSTPRGDCVAEKLRTMAGIPPFDGGAVRVGKSFTLH